MRWLRNGSKSTEPVGAPWPLETTLGSYLGCRYVAAPLQSGPKPSR